MRIIGHRGAAFLAPENTRDAYLLALELGADGVECDVHLTADGQVVCFHDFTLERTSNGTGAVRAHTLEQLRQLDVTSWKRAAPHPSLPPTPGPQLLTLADLIALCTLTAARQGRDLTLVIELKHQPGSSRSHVQRLDDAVLTVLHQAGWTQPPGASAGTLAPHGWVQGAGGRVGISLMSFDPRSCTHLAQRVGPAPVMALIDAPPGQGSAEVDRAATAQAWDLVRSGAVHGAGPGLGVVAQAPDAVAALVVQGRVVRVWTVDTPEAARQCEELGVQEITTNRPELFTPHRRPVSR